ncbi:MAG: tRNA uridine-5-carboxymethylaminomethyl(34) synthesis GTPase MnmE [Hyphomicrobium sp.]
MADASTIFALSSGSVPAGVAVIRVSGPAAPETIRLMASPEVIDRRAAFRRIVHPATGELLDQALVLYFAGPRSETGEHIAEFQVHGGRAVVRAVLDALALIPGCRMAEPGEFARRAFNNGKLDLVEIDALADLVAAETEAQRRLAMRSGGMLSTLYEGWRTSLIEIAALTEAAIDFSDEADVSSSALEQARLRAKPLMFEIARHLDDGHRGEILRDGFRVALLGPPNAGKSSLLNALARRDAAIVSEEAGTTRDVIEVRLDLDGYPVIVSDTAGIRETEAPVEREGIRRALAAARDADLNLWLSETGLDTAPKEISRETILEVRTKSDLDSSLSPRPSGEDGAILAVSAKTGAGLDDLIKVIAARSAAAVGDDGDVPLVAQARHRTNLEAAVANIGDFLAGSAEDLELRAEDMRRAAHALGRITGRVDVEDVLGQIFSRFCIGK